MKFGYAKKSPARWGKRAGVGVRPRGAEEAQSFLMRHAPLGRKNANLLKLFVGKKPFFFVPSALHVPNSGFVRDSGKLLHREAQQVGRARPGHVFRYLIVHLSPLTLESGPYRLLPRPESSPCKCRRPRLRQSSFERSRCFLSEACRATEPECLLAQPSEPPPARATPRTRSACSPPQDKEVACFEC